MPEVAIRRFDSSRQDNTIVSAIHDWLYLVVNHFSRLYPVAVTVLVCNIVHTTTLLCIMQLHEEEEEEKKVLQVRDYLFLTKNFKVLHE